MIEGAKPFVKWAGGKKQLLDDIIQQLPADFRKREIIYVEPFVGGGAVLFSLLRCFPNIQHAIINDINRRLINVYFTIKDTPHELISRLKILEQEYLPLSQECRKLFYLEKRMLFNSNDISSIEQASLFIFLNRTCFNGLYRENSKGEFNVPHGKYKSPKICDETTLIADHLALQRVEILCGDFSVTEKFASPNTLYYFDPPYKPLSTTSSFNSYVKEPFDDMAQIRLRDFCNKVGRHGSLFILSNSDVKSMNPEDDFFDDLYEDYQIKRVFASRMLNANPDKRGKLTELIISNIQ